MEGRGGAVAYSEEGEGMRSFDYREGELYCEGVSVLSIVEEVGTPCYVYSKRGFEERYRRIVRAFSSLDPLVCYSVKANSHLRILELLHWQGSGFDVVSGGELFRVRRVGVPASRVVFAGVGKTEAEIRYAVEEGVLMLNVESSSELRLIQRVAQDLKRSVGVALRLNPDVDAGTHRYITTGKRENKFGIYPEEAERILSNLGDYPNVEFLGIHLHIGSQIRDPGPFVEAVEFALRFRERFPLLRYLNLGGGYGIDYEEVSELEIEEFAARLLPLLEESGLRLILEPGRFIAANSGILVTKILYIKEGLEKRFLICDSGMHHLIRPALYQAHHQIWPVRSAHSFEETQEHAALCFYDVVGPICESGDFLGLDVPLRGDLEEGESLAVFSAGAYGMVMASGYNSHSWPVEVLVDGEGFEVIRRRQSWEDLIVGEVYG